MRLRSSRGRKLQQRIILDGARELLRALEAGVDVREIFVCPEWVQMGDAMRALEIARGREMAVLSVAPAVFGKLAYGSRTEGVLALAQRPRSPWPDLPLPAVPLVVVLERVEKPGNLGGVLRTADAAGAAAVLVADPAVDPYNPNTIRASLGAVFSTPVAVADGGAMLDWLRDRKLQILAARTDGKQLYTEVDFTRPSAIVLGSEAEGLSDLWNGDGVVSLKIPLRGHVDSLNVSVAAGVLMYEALRQRNAS
jgi:TrmH family RNA methyltransferase